jgi:predicted AAA+ superfamily ATPase
LLPLAYSEWAEPSGAAAATIGHRLDDVLLRGSYPQLLADPGLPLHDWMASYVATYLERDVRQVLNVRDLATFQRFLRLCAGRVGQLLNLSNLASEAGISHPTARQWISVLESSDIVCLLAPHHRNFAKRLVKTPKLCFIDTGLAAWLLGIRSAEQLALHPQRGALFENWVVSEMLKAQLNRGDPPTLHFWRDNNGVEADLLLGPDTALQPVEIKSGATVTADALQAARRAASFIRPVESAKTPWLIHGGDDDYLRSSVRVWPWWRVSDWSAASIDAADPGEIGLASASNGRRDPPRGSTRP